MRYKVWTTNDGKIHHQLATSDSKLWAFVVAYFNYFAYNNIFIVSTRGEQWSVR